MSDDARTLALPCASTSETYSSPSYNHHRDRNRARPPCKPPCQPSAREGEREDGRRKTKTAPEAPSPRTPHFCNTSRAGRARVRGGWNMAPPRTLAPLALFTSSWPNEAARARIKPTTDARRARGAAEWAGGWGGWGAGGLGGWGLASPPRPPLPTTTPKSCQNHAKIM